MANKILEILGNDADYLLNHKCQTFPKEQLHLPGPDFVDRVVAHSDRSPGVMRNMQTLFYTGDLRPRDIFLYCQWIKELSILQGLLLLLILFTLNRKTSLD